jgi:tetratricopeptide (TPR) repeat protein
MGLSCASRLCLTAWASALASAVLCYTAAGAGATAADDCNSDVPDKMILGCTEVLKTASDPAVKVAAFARRGFARKQHNECEAAIADFTEALKVTESNAAILVLRGECYAEAGRPDQALADLQAALKIEPQNSEAVAALDRLRPDAAKAGRGAPAGGRAEAAGAADCNSDESDKMIAGCTSVLQSEGDPTTRVAALIRRGAAHKDKRECEPAIADFTEALRLAPEATAALVLRGQTLEMLGQSGAAADLKAALQIDPNNADALAAIASLSSPSGPTLACAPLTLPPAPALEPAETRAPDRRPQSVAHETPALPTPDLQGVVQSIGGASRFKIDDRWIELFGIDDPTTKGQHISDVYTYLKPTEGIVACFRRPGGRYQCYTGGEDLAVLALRNGFARLLADAPPEYRSLAPRPASRRK